MQNHSNCKRRIQKCSKQIILEGVLDSTQEKETGYGTKDLDLHTNWKQIGSMTFILMGLSKFWRERERDRENPEETEEVQNYCNSCVCQHDIKQFFATVFQNSPICWGFQAMEDTTCHDPLKCNLFTQSLLPFHRERERERIRKRKKIFCKNYCNSWVYVSMISSNSLLLPSKSLKITEASKARKMLHARSFEVQPLYSRVCQSSGERETGRENQERESGKKQKNLCKLLQ
jgi:hypothetical protein